jgi:hypothetical protein
MTLSMFLVARNLIGKGLQPENSRWCSQADIKKEKILKNSGATGSASVLPVQEVRSELAFDHSGVGER